MKFTAGYWEMRPGHTPFYAAQPHEIEFNASALTVHAATKRLSGRGDTLNLPLITVEFSAPMEDVIRVRIVHHKGGQNPGPRFHLPTTDCPQPVITNEGQFATLKSGRLSACVHRGDSWQVEYQAEGRTLTSSGWRSLGFVDTPQGRFIHEQLNLGVGEYVYGLGERFTSFIKNGQAVEMWNEDGGTSSELAYKNIPLYLTNRGYGIFVNHPEKVSFEVASEKVERVQFSLPGEALEYFVLYGTTPKEVLERYTALTGRPALPPAWSFGLWLSTSFTTNYDEATVTGFIREMALRRIPLHVFHFDCFWMKEFHWCDFTWDERCFPDPPGMLRRLKERGLRICLWINPYIAQRSALFNEAAEAGYLLKKPNGDTWQCDKWQAGMGIVDFTNPAACAWFQSKLRALLEMGVDAFKTDFGERIPTDAAWFDGSDPFKMRNYYSYLYNKTVFHLLKETRGEGEAVVFARSATAGGQQFPAHWGGDCTATFESMAESLRGGLSLALSGFGFWSHDIGGFEQASLSAGERDRAREAAVYKRWIAFGLLSSHSRLHGSASYRVPWAYDEEAVEVLAKFTRLKCRLMPYLYHAAIQAHQRGTPMLRAMMMEFPNDPACDTLDRQYMLGDSLLVAPVFSQEGLVDYYLPAGRWVNILNGKVSEGPRWVRAERHNFLSLPLLARPGAVIPLGFNDEQPGYDYSQEVTLNLYELAEGQKTRVEIPNTRGEIETRFEVQCAAGVISIIPQNASKPWKALLVNIHEGESSALLENTPQGILLSPAGPAETLKIKKARGR